MEKNKKFISIVTFCFNEKENIYPLYQRVTDVMNKLPYKYEFIFVDNHSTDSTVKIIKDIINFDKRVKLIVNSRNFGHIRSPNYALLQGSGDATIIITSDLQDPPEIFPELLTKWLSGYKTVLTVKHGSDENSFFYLVRRFFYKLLNKISDVPLIENATGSGLFDRSVIDILKNLNDPYPYLRGLLSEIGHPIATVPYIQPRRSKGFSKNNFYTLYDHAVLGIVNHSKIPLRLITFFGFLLSLISFCAILILIAFKFLYWDSFEFGVVPIFILIFFIIGIFSLFFGVLGEYIGSIHTHVRKLPMVIELERVNFGRRKKNNKS